MDDKPNTPVFADRYRFEPAGNDWDRGRSGYTHLVYDLKEKRLGVIKRTETISKQQAHSLQNEIKALKALKGLGVPEVFDTSQAVYDSKSYDYSVIEYIDGIRVEKNLNTLSAVERAEIITQLFGLLAQAHQKGIINGDVDLKHLFWRRENKQLVVIDWGNSRLNIDSKKKAEFSYDLARAAEIIFSLVTRQGHPSATGSIALPNASGLVSGLGVLPVEFQNLCKWAPRTPTDAVAPYTAEELYKTSKRWLKNIGKTNVPLLAIISLFVACFVLLVIVGITPIKSLITSVTPVLITSTYVETLSTFSPTNTPVLTETVVQTMTPTETLVPTNTLPPPPLAYSPIISFEDQALLPEYKLCWRNEVVPSSELRVPEGFNRKIDNTWWIFNTGDGRSVEESVRGYFAGCSEAEFVHAMGLNTWVTQIQPENGSTPGGEFGIFLKATDGFIREYMLWVDQSERLHLRIRENTQVVYDDAVLLVNMQSSGRGNVYRQFRIQIFLEMDNNGSTILYLSEAESSSVSALALDPGLMIPIYKATRPRLGSLQNFGLIGRGGSTEVLIWPLVLFGK